MYCTFSAQHSLFYVANSLAYTVSQCTTARQKVTPPPEIVADIFTKFTEFTDDDSVRISCKFY